MTVALVIGMSYSLWEGAIVWLNLQLYYKWAPSVWYSIQNRWKTKNSARVKNLIFISGKVFEKKLWIFTQFFLLFPKMDGPRPPVLSQSFSKAFRISIWRSFLGYCFHNCKGNLLTLLIISWTRHKGMLESMCSVSFDVQSFS